MTPVVLGACLFALVGAMAFIPLEAWFGHGGGDARRHVRTAAICAALFLLNSVLMRWLGDPVIAEIDARGIDLVLPTWARIASEKAVKTSAQGFSGEPGTKSSRSMVISALS